MDFLVINPFCLTNNPIADEGCTPRPVPQSSQENQKPLELTLAIRVMGNVPLSARYANANYVTRNTFTSNTQGSI